MPNIRRGGCSTHSHQSANARPPHAASAEADRLRWRGVIVLLLVCSLGDVRALDAGTASGTLLVDGRTLALSTSLAVDYTDRAGLAALADDAPALRIALAAMPLSPTLLDGPGEQRLLAAPPGGPLLVLRVPRDARGTVARAQLLLVDGTHAPWRLSVTDGVTLARGERRVLGVVDIASPDRRLRILARFSAPLFEDRAPVRDLDGDAARASPQAQALLVFEQALRQGAFARARNQATSARQRQLGDLERRDEGDIARLVAGLPAPAARRESIVRMVEIDAYAWLVCAAPRPGLIPLRADGPRWLVDAP